MTYENECDVCHCADVLCEREMGKEAEISVFQFIFPYSQMPNAKRL